MAVFVCCDFVVPTSEFEYPDFNVAVCGRGITTKLHLNRLLWIQLELHPRHVRFSGGLKIRHFQNGISKAMRYLGEK